MPLSCQASSTRTLHQTNGPLDSSSGGTCGRWLTRGGCGGTPTPSRARATLGLALRTCAPSAPPDRGVSTTQWGGVKRNAPGNDTGPRAHGGRQSIGGVKRGNRQRVSRQRRTAKRHGVANERASWSVGATQCLHAACHTRESAYCEGARAAVRIRQRPLFHRVPTAVFSAV